MRALGLFGGGLDSLLARAWLRRQGLAVESVHFHTGFVKNANRETVEHEPRTTTVDVSRDYLERVVLQPRFGYGSAMNPCLDCRIFMLRRAAELAAARGIELLFTGDVVGQRSMDQSRRALTTIEREAGVAGRVLRPLSAGLLPPTLAEQQGRFELDPRLRLHGRTRRGQLDLARHLGLERFPTPSGGCCRLADPAYARRLRDLLSHSERRVPERPALERLQRGRHLRIAWNLKLVVGRNEEECRWLERHAGEDWIVDAAGGPGALGLLEGTPSDGQLDSAGSVIARYSGRGGGGPVEISFRRGPLRRSIRVRAACEATLARWQI